MFRYLQYLLILSYIGLTTVSCRKDVPPKKDNNFGNISTDKKVFITNEGGFGYGNASITLYDPNSGNTIDDIYKTYNNNLSLGDVCQSMTKHNEKYYIVVNNSQKIVVLNDQTFIKEGTITGLISPRYILPVSNNKAYVTNLKLSSNSANYIQVIDLNTLAVTGTILCKGWTEQMVESYGKVYVTNTRSNYLYAINTINDQLQDSILIGYGSASIVKDKNEQLWITCNGDSISGQHPKLVRINPVNNQVEMSLDFPTYSSPGLLKINGTGDMLYYLKNGVYNFSITATGLSSAPIVNSGTHVFYGLGIDPLNETIYVSDAIDYMQKGKVLRYDKNGNYIDVFTAGIIPGDFYFDY